MPGCSPLGGSTGLALDHARWRRVAGGIAGIVAVVNLGLVLSFVVTRADSNVMAMVDALEGSAAVVLAGACDREETRAALTSIAGSGSVTDDHVGTVVPIASP